MFDLSDLLLLLVHFLAALNGKAKGMTHLVSCLQAIDIYPCSCIGIKFDESTTMVLYQAFHNGLGDFHLGGLVLGLAIGNGSFVNHLTEQAVPSDGFRETCLCCKVYPFLQSRDDWRRLQKT